MRGDPQDAAHVELADDDAPTPGRASPDRPGATGAVPVRTRRRWATAAVLVLGAALVAGALVSSAADRDDDDDVARLDTQPGFAGSLRSPLAELWSTEARLVGAGHDLVLVTDRSASRAVLQALDAGTGRSRWVADDAVDVLRCEETVGALLCEVPGSGLGAPNTDELLREVPGELLALDPVDGRVLGRSDLDGRVVDWSTAGADVVVGRRAGDQLVVTRRPATPRAAGVAAAAPSTWTVELPLPASTTANQLALRVDGDAVVVEGRVGAVLDVRDGAVLVPPQLSTAPGGPVQVVVSDAGAAVWAEGGRATWFGPEGVPLGLRGGPVRESPQDGSAPEVLLLDRDGRLAAVDVRTGSGLWERPEAPWRRVSRVAGVVLVVEPGAVVAVDARSGAERWRRPVVVGEAAGPAPGAVVLDARRVLLGESLTGGGLAVIALADGVQQWSTVERARGALEPGTGPAAVLAYGLHGVAGWGVPPP
jgi:outer membrane protein assembly factor BamB